MLTRYDELMCHQIATTFDHPASSAREWTERIWFMVHDTTGDFTLVGGFGYYPNRNVMDAFMCLAVESKTQHVIRASRELRPRIDEVAVGPFSWHVIEPMKKVRAVLDKNEYGVSYDLTLDGTMPPHDEEPSQFHRFRGRVVEDIRRYFQVGKLHGWIKINSQTVNIDPKSWWMERDHSWGIRRGALDRQEVGIQPGDMPIGFFYNGASFQFDKWSANYHIREDWDRRVLNFSGALSYPYGSGKEELRLIGVQHNFTFRPDIPEIRQINGGVVTLNAVDGSKKEVAFKPLGIVYVGTGGYSYANYQGFTHGLWMGKSWMDGFQLDITDPEVIWGAYFLDEMSCKFEFDGQAGYGFTEVSVFGKYPKYGFETY